MRKRVGKRMEGHLEAEINEDPLSFLFSPLPFPLSHFDRRAESEMRVHRLREEVNAWGRKTDRYTTFLSLLSRVHSAVDWS